MMVEVRTTHRTGASLTLRDSSGQSSQSGDNEDGGQLEEHYIDDIRSSFLLI